MNSSESALTALLLTALLSACSEPAPPASSSMPESAGMPAQESPDMLDQQALAAADTISAERLRADIAEISDDSYQGRAPGSAGDVMTRQYLISQMQAAGLQPGAGNGSWEQEFELVGITTTQPDEWVFESAGGEVALAQYDEFLADSGVQEPVSTITDAEVVFVGYGIQAPEYDWDDYKNMDLQGKVLLMLNNDPDWDPELFAGFTRLYYGRWDYKYDSAARQGAAGAIIIHTTPSAGYPFQVLQTGNGGEQFELPAGDEPRSQVNAWVTEDAARRLLESVELDLDTLVELAHQREFVPVPLGLTTSLTLENTLTSKTSANVIGMLPGSDSELSDEAVIYSAHHDHLGMAEATGAEGEDLVYNGAMDNAAGVASVLEVARAFQSLGEAPRRTILFNFVGAEEQGLLGSGYYARNPTFEPGKIAANINLDGGSIWGRTRDLTYIGFGKSSLDAVVTKIADHYGRTVSGDQFPDRGLFYRSDQFNFARIGVPAVFLDGGTDVIGQPAGWGEEQINAYTEINYHQPGDELDDSWNFDGMVEDTQINFLIGVEVANDDEMPAWNPGDEFEAVRLEALQAVD